MASVTESWRGILAWFAERDPRVLESLNPGATQEDFAPLEARFSQLPAEFYELYRLNNGQTLKFDEAGNLPAGVFLGLAMLTLEEVWAVSEMHRNISEQLSELDQDLDNIRAHHVGQVKTDYASAYRVPLAADGGGNYLGLDFDPGPLGKLGQVINYGRDESILFVVAPSLGEFLTFLLECQQDGRAVIEDGTVFWTQPRMEGSLDVLHFIFNSKRDWKFADIE